MTLTDPFEDLMRLALALGIGLLVGLERGWQYRSEPDGERTAGLRTLTLAGLLGGIAAMVSRGLTDGSGLFLGLMTVAFVAVMATFRYREAIVEQKFGVTTVVAGMIAFLLGAMAVLGHMQVAAAAAVVTVAVLALKQALHSWMRNITWQELRAAIVLLTMTVVLLPLLPDRAIDPWNAINPYELWLLTVLIAAISFVGYIALKLLPEQAGVLLTALAGGLTSSTAVTMTMAGLAREHPRHARVLAGAVLVAGAVMMARVLVVVGALDREVLWRIAPPLGAAAVVLAIGGFLLSGKDHGEAESGGERLMPSNPFDLELVLKFGALLTVITALAKIATEWVGQAGAYVLAAVSGVVDVDALTLSMVRLSPGTVSFETAATAIAIVTSVNTVSKAALAWTTGGEAMGKPIAVASLIALGVLWFAFAVAV